MDISWSPRTMTAPLSEINVHIVGVIGAGSIPRSPITYVPYPEFTTRMILVSSVLLFQ